MTFADQMGEGMMHGNCGVDEQNPGFLGREKLPTIRVFAGNTHILILTAGGALYGIGGNRRSQISSKGSKEYEMPCLMATDVIEAAAGKDYSIFITGDGEVHLQGRGVFADRFSGFSGARYVFAEHWINRFWIVDSQGRTYFFGDNENTRDKILPYANRLLMELPEESCIVEFRSEPRKGLGRLILGENKESDTLQKEMDALIEKIMNSSVFGQQVRKYERKCEVTLNLNLHSCNVQDGKEEKDPNRRELRKYIPEIRIYDGLIYAPVEVSEKFALDSPHRCFSMPDTLPEKYAQKASSIKKASSPGLDGLVLYEDGRAEFYDEWNIPMLLDHEGQRAIDVALSYDSGAVAYENGDILVFSYDDDDAFGDGEVYNQRLIKISK